MTRTNFFALLLLPLLSLLALQGPAEARGGSSSRTELRAKRQAARALYDQGNRKYDTGQFREALGLFTKAYETLALPGFLFNIGQCHRMLGEHERAVFFYQGYLRRERRARNREMVERLIQECQERIAAEKARLEKARLDKARLEEERRAREKRLLPPSVIIKEVILRETPAKGTEPLSPPPPSEGSRPLVKRWWFWTALGVGAAALAVGLGAGLSGRTEKEPPTGTLGIYDPWGVR